MLIATDFQTVFLWSGFSFKDLQIWILRQALLGCGCRNSYCEMWVCKQVLLDHGRTGICSYVCPVKFFHIWIPRKVFADMDIQTIFLWYGFQIKVFQLWILRQEFSDMDIQSATLRWGFVDKDFLIWFFEQVVIDIYVEASIFRYVFQTNFLCRCLHQYFSGMDIKPYVLRYGSSTRYSNPKEQ